MCGIVGYLGPMDPKDVIVEGLKKLEYRGYDSAGVAILSDGQTKRVRSQGKLVNLEEKLSKESIKGHIGIGHTRWATHGVPSERNAHPHFVDGVSLVHNGIIENYLDIKKDLLASGAQLTSDTDSELVAHLIAREVLKTKNLLSAVQNVLPKLHGAFSILVMWEKSPKQLVAFKDGPPLVVGVGQGQTFVASDVQAVLQHTKNFIYLEDREIVNIEGDQLSILSADGKKLDKKVVEINWSPDLTEKQGFAHFMLKEIYEQPRAVAQALEPHLDLKNNQLKLSRVGFGTQSVQELEGLDLETDWKKTLETFSKIEKVFFVACGTSYYASQVGKYYIESLARLETETDIASEFRYRNPILNEKTLVITISQSGETADTLAAIRLAKQMGAKTLSICNVKSSSIDREAHGHVYMNTGPEIGVASTKAFTSTLGLLVLISGVIAKAKQPEIFSATEKEVFEALLKLPSQMEVVLSYDKYFDDASETLQKFKGFLYMGRGVSFPIAMEGALKMKELAYLHAEGYAAGEMKHGPLALIDERILTVMLAPKDEHYEKTISNLQEVKARSGKIISIGSGADEKLEGMSEYYLPLPQSHWMTSPILATLPLQLMAYHVSCRMGNDVDQPRNLAKSVTVE